MTMCALGKTMLFVRWLLLGSVLVMQMACSPSAPMPSPLFDGHYVGARHADPTEACGTDKADAPADARINQGEITLRLFRPQSEMSSGHFPRMAILTGQMADDSMDGEATDFRCRATVHLHKTHEHVPSFLLHRHPRPKSPRRKSVPLS